jgi:sialate O-acetylesterase
LDFNLKYFHKPNKMNKLINLRSLLLLALLIVTGQLMADVKIPDLLSSNMVVQRDGTTMVWGQADAGEKIAVSFRDETIKTKASKVGLWKLKINTGAAGGPFDLVIQGKNTIILTNVMVGDVWVCSGQSNMEWPLLQTVNGPADINKANYPNIRLFQVQKNPAIEPVAETLPAKWEVCTPQTVAAFSAVGFYFGRKINAETNIPIGLISSNWGGTKVEPWMSANAAQTDEVLVEWLTGIKQIDFEKIAAEQKQIFELYKVELNKVSQPDFTHEYINENFNDADWMLASQPELWENVHGYEFFDGIMWYRKWVDIPVGFNVNKAKLGLAKIDDSDIVWVNGVRVGETFNQYNVTREYDLPQGALKHGNNLIVVRVEDYTGGGGFHGFEQEMFLFDGINLISIAGEWKMTKDKTPTPQNPTGAIQAGLSPNQFPTLLFNGMINPLLNFAVKGAIWYQGESNADFLSDALRYEKLLLMMINDWRTHWGVGELSFYQVQLANYKAETITPQNQVWPYLREAQSNLAKLPNIEAACIIDIGDAADIHPRNKRDVGERLALKSLKNDYGFDVIADGPRYKSHEIEGDKAIVTLDLAGANLVVKNKYGYVNGFALAGPDKVFHYAKARQIAPNQIEVSCEKISEISAVRFLWADNPGEINLYNNAGLPAEPFRTDKW